MKKWTLHPKLFLILIRQFTYLSTEVSWILSSKIWLSCDFVDTRYCSTKVHACTTFRTIRKSAIELREMPYFMAFYEQDVWFNLSIWANVNRWGYLAIAQLILRIVLTMSVSGDVLSISESIDVLTSVTLQNIHQAICLILCKWLIVLSSSQVNRRRHEARRFSFNEFQLFLLPVSNCKILIIFFAEIDQINARNPLLFQFLC